MTTKIADRAGVRVGTAYRHFPKRSGLIIAVLEREVDEVIDAGLNDETSEPVEAISTWLHHYMAFVSTKRGLASALHSGDAAYEGLPAYFLDRLQPHLEALPVAAVSANRIRGDTSARDLLRAVAHLGVSRGDDGLDFNQRMIGLLLKGLTVRK